MEKDLKRLQRCISTLDRGGRVEISFPFHLTFDEIGQIEYVFAGLMRTARRNLIATEPVETQEGNPAT